VDLSGIIFVLLAIAWAVFLIPKALKHHDEVARTRSIDRFSESTRVLARREPVNDRDTRLVVTPPRVPAQRSTAPDLSTARPAASPSAALRPSQDPSQQPEQPTMRAAARAAARRRRRVLGALLLLVVAAVAAVVLAAAPWWTVVAAGGLTVAYLVLCRTQVKQEGRVLRVPAAAPAPAPVLDEPAAQERDHEVEIDLVSDEGAEDTLGISFAALQEAAAAPTAGSLWDPLPVTLPTYVTKPKASRTVRTIDLGAPGTWSSGRTVVDATRPPEGPAQPAPAAADTTGHGEDQQRAVGS
jgi:hypothetical protein